MGCGASKASSQVAAAPSSEKATPAEKPQDEQAERPTITFPPPLVADRTDADLLRATNSGALTSPPAISVEPEELRPSSASASGACTPRELGLDALRGVPELTDDEALLMVRRQLSGLGKWGRSEHQATFQGVSDALSATQGRAAVHDALLRAVSACLMDDDPTVRAGAVASASEVASELGPDVFADALDKGGKLLFGEVATPLLEFQTLEVSLLKGIGAALEASCNGSHLQRLQTSALASPSHADALLGTLARLSADWVIDNTGSLVSAGSVGFPLLGIESCEARQRYVQKIVDDNDSELIDALREELEDTFMARDLGDEEQQKLLLLLPAVAAES